MNAREGMEWKLVALEILGMDKELIKEYCPELPDENEEEVLPEDWLDAFTDRVSDVHNKWIPLDGLISNARVFELLCMSAPACPYCAANRIHDANECTICSFGKVYSICTEEESHWMQLTHKVGESEKLKQRTINFSETYEKFMEQMG